MPTATELIARQQELDEDRKKAIVDLLDRQGASKVQYKDALDALRKEREKIVADFVKLQEDIASQLEALGYKKPRAKRGEGKRAKARQQAAA